MQYDVNKTEQETPFSEKTIKFSPHIQGGREISAIIVNDNWLCYKESKCPYKLFIILEFNKLFTFKTSDE